MRSFIAVLGHNGTRVFYLLLGLFILTLSVQAPIELTSETTFLVLVACLLIAVIFDWDRILATGESPPIEQLFSRRRDRILAVLLLICVTFGSLAGWIPPLFWEIVTTGGVLYVLVGALFDWKLAYRHRLDRFVIRIVGRRGVRGFYVLLCLLYLGFVYGPRLVFLLS